jgi:hypothetical protein
LQFCAACEAVCALCTASHVRIDLLDAHSSATAIQLHYVCLWAALQGHAAVLQLLLQSGCIPDVNIADKCGSTALHTAAAGGHLAAVQLLLQAGVAVDACATANATALHCAAAAGLVMCPDAAAVVKERIRRQDISSSSSSGALGQQQQQQECGRWPGLLIDFRSYSSSSSSSSKCSSVSDLSCDVAAASAVVAALLAAGASTAAADSAGWLPLHWAVARGCSRTVQHLLQHEQQDAHSSSSSSSSSSSVNAATTADGWSPLHLAVMLRRSSVVQQLLQHPGCQVGVESCQLPKRTCYCFLMPSVCMAVHAVNSVMA